MGFLLCRFRHCATVLLVSIFLMLAFSLPCFADLQDADDFQNTEWTKIVSYDMGENMWLQSICVTDNYIVCMLNNDDEGGYDQLLAFYKNSVDADGNNVKPYSLAMDVQEMDYEHGNGMTYNPLTNEIVIAAGNVENSSNKGCVFVVDADTLKFKKKVQLSKKWNVQSIDYSSTTDSYIVQKNQKGGFQFTEFDTDFNKIGDMSSMVEMGFSGEANTFQDMCVLGDNLICLPRNKAEQYNANIQVYSRSYASLLGEYSIALPSSTDDVELESISQLSPGNLVLGANVGKKPATLVLYAASLPMAYSVETSIDNGTISDSSYDLGMGEDYKVTWEPDEYYETGEVIVDGETVNIGRKTSYTFSSVTDNHTIYVKCTEIPKFKVSTKAVHGSIDESCEIRRDESVTLNFTPDEHYELDKIYVNGKEVFADDNGSSVTIDKVTGKTKVKVVFKEKQVYMISAVAKHGSVSSAYTRGYQGEDTTVNFKGDKDFVLTKVLIDGEKLSQLPTDGSYTFTNVQEIHDIQIFYSWKYMPVVYGVLLLILLLLLFRFLLHRKRKNKKQKNKEKNEKLKADLEEKQLQEKQLQEKKLQEEMRAIMLLDEGMETEKEETEEKTIEPAAKNDDTECSEDGGNDE